MVGSSPVARDAAEFVLAQESGVSRLSRTIASRLLQVDDEDAAQVLAVHDSAELRAQVGRLREQLRRDPRRTLIWTELARHYATHGSRKHAERAMRTALGLSPNHRYVLRAAVRLEIHYDRFRDAHNLIVDSELTRADPWLTATEISAAVVANRRPRLVRSARQMLADGDFLPHSTAELASALGTLELRAGNDRAARRLFAASLRNPNENAIAQGEWASRQLRGVDVPKEQFDVSAEAQAWRYSEEGDWSAALSAAWAWYWDQPFSSRPAVLGSYEASMGMDFREGVSIAKLGLQANPNNFLLQNNLVFCLTGLGEIEDAKRRFDHIDREHLDSDEIATYTATAGLLAFRSGDPDKGVELYLQTIGRMRDRKSRMIATIMLARELLLHRLPQASQYVQEADQLAADSASDPDVGLWMKHLPSEASD